MTEDNTQRIDVIGVPEDGHLELKWTKVSPGGIDDLPNWLWKLLDC